MRSCGCLTLPPTRGTCPGRCWQALSQDILYCLLGKPNTKYIRSTPGLSARVYCIFRMVCATVIRTSVCWVYRAFTTVFKDFRGFDPSSDQGHLPWTLLAALSQDIPFRLLGNGYWVSRTQIIYVPRQGCPHVYIVYFVWCAPWLSARF